MGVSGITIDNFLTMYDDAVNSSFDVDTITRWDSLGDALMSATDAQKAYEEALSNTNTSLLQANETIRQNALTLLNNQLTAWISALGAVQGAIDTLNPSFKTFTFK